MVTLTGSGCLLKKEEHTGIYQLILHIFNVLCLAAVGYLNFHTELSSICEIIVSHDYFSRLKNGQLCNII